MSKWFARREKWNPQGEDARDAAAIDYARIIHSASFRRLQGKTQVLNLGDSDFYRTRLTHSIEVAQIAGGIARQLEKDNPSHPARPFIPDLAMIQAIGVTHDLGHPPFGHGGEVALNYCMRSKGGFEGNGQTLRILSRLEKFSEGAGANLTRRTLLGVLKYPAAFSAVASTHPARSPRLQEAPSAIKVIDRVSSKPPKCYMDTEQDVVEWILSELSQADRERFASILLIEGKHSKTLHKSFDCTIMDVADDISFGIHDLEDALELRLIDEHGFRELITEDDCGCFLDVLKVKYSDEFGNDIYQGFVEAMMGEPGRRKRFVNRLVHHFITNCRIEADEAFEDPLLRYRVALPEGQRRFLDALKEAVARKVIRSPSVQHLEFKGQGMVVAVFEALSSDPEALLPAPVFNAYQMESNPDRAVCDHVAGMTDMALMKTYERLFSPRMGSVFDMV
ncbi:anti-phage deoxyguanosine triphosphatase [Agrobacterium cavarae]|uniref:anti-phage deoxyguanosine triphosphatase n=1 Tax=Agrobacterium cavarae TaxID=2528239 RepID=UPI0028B108FE|nr:anti-phage deoxyguanosine triphosphatase [Agrobacterium cavarae]